MPVLEFQDGCILTVRFRGRIAVLSKTDTDRTALSPVRELTSVFLRLALRFHQSARSSNRLIPDLAQDTDSEKVDTSCLNIPPSAVVSAIRDGEGSTRSKMHAPLLSTAPESSPGGPQTVRQTASQAAMGLLECRIPQVGRARLRPHSHADPPRHPA